MHPDQPGIAAGAGDGVCHHLAVILLVDPAAAGKVNAADKGFQHLCHWRVAGDVGAGKSRARGDIGLRTVIFRRVIDKRGQRDVAGDPAILQQHKPAGLGDLADRHEIEVPLVEDLPRRVRRLGLQHHQHALLAFREHELICTHAFLARRHQIKVHLHAEAALRRHLHRGGGQACRPHILNGQDSVGGHQFKAGFHQQLAGERVADLDRRPLGFGFVGKFGRGHGRAMNAVAPRLCPDIDHRVARAGCGRAEDAVAVRQPDSHGIHQNVAVVGRVEIHLAANGRDADAVAIPADTGDDAGQKVTCLFMVRRAETKRVQQRNRPCAHGEDIAKNAADACRCALIGLDEGGVVMALDLEDGGKPVTDIDGASVLAGALDHLRAVDWQGLQPFLRGFVRTVFRPHGREDTELAHIRCAAEAGQDEFPLLLRQAHGGGVLEGHFRFLFGRAHAERASRQAVRSVAPSALPSSGEMARSGWGIMPMTRPFGETMPAMSRAAPFGFDGPTISLSA